VYTVVLYSYECMTQYVYTHYIVTTHYYLLVIAVDDICATRKLQLVPYPVPLRTVVAKAPVGGNYRHGLVADEPPTLPHVFPLD